jgi:sulfhydrogenase subunit beta (sulfur reductase)
MSTRDQTASYLPRSQLQHLLELLQHQGYACYGPQARDGAIQYLPLDHTNQLPRGITQQQSAGNYRLQETGHQRYFAWANGPQALKPLLFTPHETLWRSTVTDEGYSFTECIPEPEKRAVIGVRACDIAALYIHDKHFLQQAYRDPYYLARRQQLLLVAVHCSHPAETCFCASTHDGPAASYGYDLALSELDDGFIIEAHTETGIAIKNQLDTTDASPAQIQAAADAIHQAAQQQRQLPSAEHQQQILNHLDHQRWQDIATRCLSCGNCTAVCPTCFCHSERDEAVLDGSYSDHSREWDSCFTQGHSYIHGITIRADTDLRYRQWLTHKLGSWHQQYGRSGCVGCGRCISWCPVGIDITEEATIISQGNSND